jgi:natural product biosynthesis luciferase-like monooxygenase protein
MSIQNVNPTDTERALGPDQAADRGRLELGPRKVPDMLDFSLLFFANRESVDPAGEYGLLLDSGQFADASGFRALWLPERHFHPFGGSFPSPALAAAALAVATRNVRLRAGSVVLPLQDPLRVVEDWAFVDNLSGGRVDVAIATGWNANDFVLAPERYENRRQWTFDTIDLLKSLWSGDSVVRVNGQGERVEIKTYPRPVQRELDLWMTCSSDPRTFVEAGLRGMNVLTALLFQSVDDLAPRIQAYREARAQGGFDPDTGIVTVMLHTFVGKSDDEVREIIHEPFVEYLRSSIDLWRTKWTDLGSVPPDKLLQYAFERYFRTSALFGSVERCAAFADRLRSIGVNELACLIDFGAATNETLEALPHLAEVRRRTQRHSA